VAHNNESGENKKKLTWRGLSRGPLPEKKKKNSLRGGTKRCQVYGRRFNVKWKRKLEEGRGRKKKNCVRGAFWEKKKGKHTKKKQESRAQLKAQDFKQGNRRKRGNLTKKHPSNRTPALNRIREVIRGKAPGAKIGVEQKRS